jgi:PAS domain S-box-containing protein
MGQFELDANGRPETMLGAIRDITEQKLAEASLRESKELLQLFIEHAPVALAMYDSEMRVLAVSKRCLDVYGVSAEQVLGRSPYELVPNMPERWKQEHRRGLAGEAVRIDEDRFERADGTVRWLRRELLPWRRANGEVGGIITLTEDITRAKEAEERLKLAANVFTHASEAIVITALDGSILEVNEAFTRVTGYTRDEALGKNPRILQSGLHFMRSCGGRSRRRDTGGANS